MTSLPTGQATRRLRLSWSLRSMCALLLIATICVGLVSRRIAIQRRAVAWVQERGGYVSYEFEVDERGAFIPLEEQNPSGWIPRIDGRKFPDLQWRVVSLDLQEVQVLGAAAPWTDLTDVKSLTLAGCRIADVNDLSRFHDLRDLDLPSCQVSNLDWAASLPKLRFLNLYKTNVQDLRPLVACKELKTLRLEDTGVTDLGPLAELPKLKELGLSGTPVSDISALSSLANLEVLSLSDTRVGSVDALSNLRSLKTLVLDRTPVTRIAPIANLGLEQLMLEGSPIQDVVLLKTMRSLKFLSLSSGTVSVRDWEELRLALPGVVLSLTPSP